MISGQIQSVPISSFAGAKAKAYLELLKVRLSMLVAFSCAFGYGLATQGNVNWTTLIMLTVGGFLLSGASGCINQIIERDFDKLMSRTMKRPLPTGRVSVNEAIVFSIVCLLVSFTILIVFTNTLTVVLSFVSMVLYSFVYTPLKRVGPVAVFVGAIPGALPPLLGWIAATGSITHEAMIIFGIQFIWQFPHFYAIGWLYREDYARAGMLMLPAMGENDGKTTFRQILISAQLLIFASLALTFIAPTGGLYFALAIILGLAFYHFAYQASISRSKVAAKRLLHASVIYLPLLYLAMVLDKLITTTK